MRSKAGTVALQTGYKPVETKAGEILMDSETASSERTTLPESILMVVERPDERTYGKWGNDIWQVRARGRTLGTRTKERVDARILVMFGKKMNTGTVRSRTGGRY